MNGLNYLLQTNLYLLLFMSFYVLVLRNETFFRQNRIFLNSSIFLSFVIPFINSNWFRDLFITQKVREAAIIPSQMIYNTVIVGVNEDAASISLADAIFWVYISGAILLLIRLFTRLVQLRRHLEPRKGRAFSFFNTLVVDPEIPKAGTIIDHEKVHMRQWHSADIIFIELAAIINWFNPVMYLYKKEIRHIHEFIADEEAAALMQSKSDYALLLFSNTLGIDPLQLSNNFFNRSLLKRRVMMLHKNRSRSTGLWKYGFSAPLFMLMLVVSAALASSKENALSIDGEKSLKTIQKIGALSLPASLGTEAAGTMNNNTDNGIAALDNAGVPKTSADQSDLKNHIAENIKYTEAARAARTYGNIQVNFRVRNKRISNVEITKGLHMDLDKEVLNAFASFNSELSIPDNDYVITVSYLNVQVPVKDQTIEKIPQSILQAKNYLGYVIAMVNEAGTVKGAGITTSRLNPTTKQQELMGYNGSTAQDRLPEFPGGIKAWNEYLLKTLKYPASARNNKVEGRVIVSFTIDKDGSIEDIKVLRGIGSGADEEAVRVIARSPNWLPGTKDGDPIKVSYTVPINFSLPGTGNPSIIKVEDPSQSSALTDFSKVEVLPEFHGGMEGWGKYLKANLKYPELARKDKVTGRVIMSFIVEKDGTLSEIKVLRGIGSGLDEEAVRVLKNSPNWKPGILGGRPVRVAYTMPIFFQLAANNDKSKANEVKPGN